MGLFWLNYGLAPDKQAEKWPSPREVFFLFLSITYPFVVKLVFFLFRKELEELSVKAHQQVIQRQKRSRGEIAKDYVSTDMTESAKFSDVHELEPSLQAICEAMWELIQ